MLPAFTITIPRLATERLTPREYRQSDFDAFADFYASSRSRFVGGPMPPELAWRALAVHLGHWSLRGFGFWAVEETATGRFCGHVGLWHPEGWPEPEVGWVLMGGVPRGAGSRARLPSPPGITPTETCIGPPQSA